MEVFVGSAWVDAREHVEHVDRFRQLVASRIETLERHQSLYMTGGKLAKSLEYRLSVVELAAPQEELHEGVARFEVGRISAESRLLSDALAVQGFSTSFR